ncbi:MAG: tyrosine-protein phosphatase [Candidatus Azobacteroides sp.]|nr:tyrosine-protein phosphatase [Candidatus Azobacteroides sp.]
MKTTTNSFILFLTFTTLFVLLSSCKKEEYDITVVCEEDQLRNYVVKWETFPVMNGTVKIYRSDNPDNFSNKLVELELPIQDGIAVMKKNNSSRSYFKLVFGKQMQVITSNKIISTDNIVNLRALGGYYNDSDRQVKWGKIYRSGALSKASQADIALIKSLHIKTVIDLRTDEEIAKSPSAHFTEQTFSLPLKGFDPQSMIEKVINGRMKKGDALVSQQDLYASIIRNNTNNFKRYFEILADSSNYPIIICCTLGKDRTGIVSAFTLAILGVDREQIHQDYMLSNLCMDLNTIVSRADTLSPEVQEALTILLASKRQIMEYTWKYIDKQYGSLDNYFEKELGITAKQRQRLKNTLLYM